MDWLLIHLPIFVLVATLICAERLSRAPRTDWQINLMAWGINALAAVSVWRLVQRWHGAALIDADQLPGWLAVIIYVMVFDLAEYLFHRAQHKIPLLWSMHSMHHSDPEMSVLTTNRHFWADPLFKTITVWSAAAMVITTTQTALAVYALLSFWNLMSHSQLRLNLGRWSWLINTPAYHRRHHSSDPAHYDSNFASLFPIWDVIFGDYHQPDGFPPTGLDHRPRNLGQLLAWPLYYRRKVG